MRRPAKVFILAAAALLIATSGCGTRSIVVPVMRPAQINLHLANSVLITPTESADNTALSGEIAVRVDSLLPGMLSDGDQTIRFSAPDISTPALLQRNGDISRRSLRWWSSQSDAGVLLCCQIVRSRLTEEVTTVEIQSSRNPGGVKVVRQGRAEAACRVLLIEMRKEKLLFDDTLQVTATDETHAADSLPPLLNRSLIADRLALQISAYIVGASHPVRDRDVVTFLTDSEFPGIETAITYAEEGRWKLASELLRRLIDEAEEGSERDLLWYDLGLTLQYQQNFKEALAAFDQAIKLKDRSRYRHARAALLLAEEDFLNGLE